MIMQKPWSLWGEGTKIFHGFLVPYIFSFLIQSWNHKCCKTSTTVGKILMVIIRKITRKLEVDSAVTVSERTTLHFCSYYLFFDFDCVYYCFCEKDEISIQTDPAMKLFYSTKLKINFGAFEKKNIYRKCL